MTVCTLFVWIFLSEAYYAGHCLEDPTKVSISHAQSLVENLTAPRHERITAMQCLSHYGTDGTLILSKVLERELDNPDSINSVLAGLASIEDRGVIEPILRFLGNESKGHQQPGPDSGSTDSMKLKPYLKENAVRILVYLAFTSIEDLKFHDLVVGDSLIKMGNSLIPVT